MTGTPPVGLSHFTHFTRWTVDIRLILSRLTWILTATQAYLRQHRSPIPSSGSVTNSPSATYTPTLDLLLVFPAIRDAPFLFLPSPSPPLSQASTPLQSVIKYHLDRGDFSRLGHHYRLFFFFRSPHHRIPRWAHDALF